MKAQLIPEAKLSVLEKQTLRCQLDEFYGKVSDYIAFEQASHQTIAWSNIRAKIDDRLQKKGGDIVMILEIGAGRSGFGEWLKEQGLRDRVRWSTQDVTTQNARWLDSQADEIFYGDVSEIPATAQFDIVFSTYVLEHVTDPAIHLNYLHSFLRPDGSLFIFCPRYDLPGYFCPSSRHLNWFTRLGFGLQWGGGRLNSLVSGRPTFLIQTDLAAFHQPFFIDADAVHWVSLLDLKQWTRSKGAMIRSLQYGSPKSWSKDWIVKRFLTCAVEIRKSVQIDSTQKQSVYKHSPHP
jgi:SAM-dependent methyltransferase